MCKTIKQTVRFRAVPKQIFQLLTDSKQYALVTGKKARISTKVGGTFSVQSGQVTGLNVDLAPGKRVVQAWRTRDFPIGIFSMAAFQLSHTKTGGTELVLTHRGVPKQLIPKVEAAWKQFYRKIGAHLLPRKR